MSVAVLRNADLPDTMPSIQNSILFCFFLLWWLLMVIRVLLMNQGRWSSLWTVCGASLPFSATGLCKGHGVRRTF